MEQNKQINLFYILINNQNKYKLIREKFLKILYLLKYLPTPILIIYTNTLIIS